MNKVKVVWTDESLIDLEVIYDFLAEHSLEAAKQIIGAILSRTGQLETFPKSGSPQETIISTRKKYRYLVEGHYKIIYSLENNVLYIETVVDTRRNPVI